MADLLDPITTLLNEQNVPLEGRHVRLEPMEMHHHGALCEAGLDPELWKLSPRPMRDTEDIRQYMKEALAWRDAGTAIPYVTVDRASGRIVGSTRFANLDRANRRAEIGWTWIARPWQRTHVNTEAKLLMLSHAFDRMAAIRVELKTDSRNERSRSAILRLGATQEGVFRNHMLLHDGYLRDTVYFSIIDSEWPRVREGLVMKLNRPEPR